MCAPLLLSLLLAPALPAQDVGEPARELEAAHWFNWIGDGPSIESLRGRTVLVHFFVCEEPEKNGFQTLCKFHEDHADKGLVILAVAPEAMGTVRRLLGEYPLPFPVGAGCADREGWGIAQERGQVLIDPRGEVFYRADAANAVWNGKLMKALKGARRLGERGTLALRPEGEHSKRWRSTLEDLAEGELAKALKALERVIDSDKADAADVEEAHDLADSVSRHVEHLLEQIDAELARGEALLARRALEALADELKRHPLGVGPLDRLAELERDEGHARELEAAETYEDLVTAYFTRGLEKNRARFDKLIEDYQGTRAAEKAAAWVKLVMTRKF